MPRPAESIPLIPGSAMKFGSSGLAKLGWLNRLKNSARSCNCTLSVIWVFLNTAQLNSLNDGPRSELRARLPKCRVPVRQLVASEVPSFVVLPKVQGVANDVRLMKLAGELP